MITVNSIQTAVSMDSIRLLYKLFIIERGTYGFARQPKYQKHNTHTQQTVS